MLKMTSMTSLSPLGKGHRVKIPVKRSLPGYTTTEEEVESPPPKKPITITTPNHAKATPAPLKVVDPKRNAMGSQKIRHRGVHPWSVSQMVPKVPCPPSTLNMTSSMSSAPVLSHQVLKLSKKF